MTRKTGTSEPNATRERATLRTIAEATGYSLSTVSLALRRGSTLREETLQRVADAAARLGYVPNRAGVRLRTGKTNVISLVLDRSDESTDFSRQLLQGIGQAIRGTPYHLNVTPEFDRNYSVGSVRYILDNRTADGLIITHTSAHDPRVKLLMEAGFPFVTHGRTAFATPHPYHDFNSERFAELAVERLAHRGCRSALLMIGGDTTNNYGNIVGAFERTAAERGMRTRIAPQQNARAASAALVEFGRTLADDPGRPDGIVSDSELRTICLLAGLAEKGVLPGRHIAIVSKQTSDLLSSLHPGVDTIEEDVFSAGKALAGLLIRAIAGEAPGTLQTLTEPAVHWRT